MSWAENEPLLILRVYTIIDNSCVFNINAPTGLSKYSLFKYVDQIQ